MFFLGSQLISVNFYSPIEVTIKTLVELIEEGKIKYIGLSECSGVAFLKFKISFFYIVFLVLTCFINPL